MTRLRLWLLDHLPAGVLARPAEWFLAILCLLSGPSILIGLTKPPSVEALLPPLIYGLWGGALVLGGLGLTCGLTSYKRTLGGVWVVTRVPCYRLGLRLLGASATLYALAQVVFAGWQAALAAGITLTFALMCGVRLLTLGPAK